MTAVRALLWGCLLVGLLTACAGVADPFHNGWVSSEGTPLRYLFSDVAYSPDGTRLAWVGVTPDARFAVGLAEDGVPIVITGSDVGAVDLAWMPDSQQILVADYGVSQVLDGVADVHTLVIIDLDGNVVRRLTPTVDLRFGAGMAVRDDGQAVVAAVLPAGEGDANADLVSIDLDTGEVEPLTSTEGVDERGPSLAADGSIVFRSGAVDNKSAAALAIRDRDGQTRTLTGPDLAVGSPSVHGPTGTVIFSAAVLTPQRQQPTVWTMTIDGSHLQMVNAEPFAQVRWHPDGRSAVGLMTGGQHASDIGELSTTPQADA